MCIIAMVFESFLIIINPGAKENGWLKWQRSKAGASSSKFQ